MATKYRSRTEAMREVAKQLPGRGKLARKAKRYAIAQAIRVSRQDQARRQALADQGWRHTARVTNAG